jgi:hypothetical protein
LLGELKVAWLYSQHALNGLFSAVTWYRWPRARAAAILKWQKALGTLAPGKRADLLVIDGVKGDPYEALIRAKETAIHLVMINGIGRYGTPGLMGALGLNGETLRVGGLSRRLFLEQQSADPDVSSVSLRSARTALRKAFRDLPKLARALEQPRKLKRIALDAPQRVVWSLALDEIQPTGFDQRPRLPFRGPRDFTGPDHLVHRAAAQPLSKILQPITLDPLTVADDRNFLAEIGKQPNVPEAIRSGLVELY